MPDAIKGLLSFALCAGLAGWGVWSARPQPFATTGGAWFPDRLLHPLPHFAQGDPRWGDHLLGPTRSTLRAEGCAVACAAMVLSGRGADTDPGRLNAALSTNGGYTDRGWIWWEKAAEAVPVGAWKYYEAQGSAPMLDRALRQGLTPILRLQMQNGTTHFVVAVGKEGRRYLILDPGRQDGGIPAFLDERYNGPVTGLRIYRFHPR